MRIFLLIIGFWFIGISSANADKLKVVTSFSILADMVSEIGGEQISVINLVGPDQDAHVYEPTPDVAKSLLAADVIVANGLGFEPWLERLVVSTETQAKKIDASKGVLPITLQHEQESIPDPHAWQNLANAEIYVRNITQSLIAADSANKALYLKRRDNYLAAIHKLLKNVTGQFKNLPQSRRRIITSHDAFAYFGQAFGLEFIAPQGISTDKEPSVQDIARLIRQIRDEDVSAIFIENIRDPRLVQQIADEAGIKIGGTLYSDALASTGPASTYLGMYQYNVNTLMKTLY